ncbi:MAG: class I SAM-dependent methyltransferase [Aestuariivirga sp.]
MYALLDRAFAHVVKTGSFEVIDSQGHSHRYGDGTGAPLKVRLHDPRTETRLGLNADLAFGESYMDGTLTVEQGTIYDVLALLMSNMDGRPLPPAMRGFNSLRRLMKRVDQYNPVGKAQKNVAHHYDLNGALYDLFLDRDRQYSCAYFENDNSSLDDAQLAKKRHIAAKLQIKPGMKILDIGSGWGGLGLYLAEVCGADVTGVTLSEEQHKLSNERAAQRGLAGRAQFRLLDYRQLDEKFDRIVSVGMFEHVGVVHYKEFFRKCSALLKDDGVAVLHSINRSDGPGATSGWIKKYIFPGGYIPALSEVLPHLERHGLYVTDIEILRLHYARTIREWSHRFADSRERAKAIYDERFCRMWEFYLAASECAFRYDGMNNFQIQFCKNQHALPLQRNYMIDEENRLRAAESGIRRLKSVAR